MRVSLQHHQYHSIMKRYKLNQAYIDRELALYHNGNAAEVLAVAEQRLNEQANGCREDIISWALQGMTIDEIHDQLVEWNNHTLANHMEVIRDIYREAINRKAMCNKTVTYHRPPTKGEIAFGYGATHYIDLPYLECLNRFGKLKKRLKGRDGLWYSR